MKEILPSAGKAGLRSRRGRNVGLRTAAVLTAVLLAPCAAFGQAPQRDPQLNIPVMLVRNALTAVNHGNLTGNYTVLRDLGGPIFRDRNSAAQLAVIFQRLREQKTDLSPVLIQEPVFSEVPTVNQAGELQLVGFFPTQPLQVHFRLGFQRIAAGWVIDTVSVGAAGSQVCPQNVGNLPQQQAPNVTLRPADGHTR